MRSALFGVLARRTSAKIPSMKIGGGAACEWKRDAMAGADLKDGANRARSEAFTEPGRFRRLLRVVLVLASCGLLSGAAAFGGEKPERGGVAEPLRIVNLHPFHLLYGVPASFGARVLAPGSSELILSADMASYLVGESSGPERVLLDGETGRLALALRGGFRDRWEWFVEAPLVAHRAGAFDAFIEGWHDFFGLPQGGRDKAPRDRLAIFYEDETGTRVNIRRSVLSLGDVSFGAGYAPPRRGSSNDGLAIRASVKLPTGDGDSLAGSGGFSSSVWAETSGALPGASASRGWLYAATLGALVAETPRNLPEFSREWSVFGRFGVTWRPLARLALTAQIDVHSSPYGSSRASPLSDPIVLMGLGGALRLSAGTTLEVALTEDDGSRASAPDVGLHFALRRRL